MFMWLKIVFQNKIYIFFNKRSYKMTTRISSQYQGHNKPSVCNEWQQQ